MKQQFISTALVIRKKLLLILFFNYFQYNLKYLYDEVQ